MSCLSVELENGIINNLLRGQSLNFGGGASGPATLSTWAGLFIALPVGGAGGVEVSGGSYGRVEIESLPENWYAPSNGQTANQIAIRFSKPTAGWGTILGVGLWSAETGGTMLLHGVLTPSRAVLSTSPAQVFVPGALILKLDKEA